MNFKLNEELKITVEKLENLRDKYILGERLLESVEDNINSSKAIIDHGDVPEEYIEKLISKAEKFIKTIEDYYVNECLHTNWDKYIIGWLDFWTSSKATISHITYRSDCKDCGFEKSIWNA